MDPGTLVGFFIGVFVSLIMFSIGMIQFNKEDPVAFYTGENGPKRDELTDVKKWNHSHGLLWIGYGISLLIAFSFVLLPSKTVLIMIPILFFSVGPFPVMVFLHHKFIKLYKKDQEKDK